MKPYGRITKAMHRRFKLLSSLFIVSIVAVVATFHGMSPARAQAANLPVAASVSCGVANVQISVTNGDLPMTLTLTLPGPVFLSLNVSAYGLVFSAPIASGPFLNVTLTELSGDQETLVLGNITCGGPGVTLQASAACNGSNLDVTIAAGDPNFNISVTTGPSSASNVGTGVTSLPGPGSWTGVTVTELSGDNESTNLGNYTCPVVVAGNTLRASAGCDGSDLVVAISGGDAPFAITGAGSGLPRTLAVPGSSAFSGPDTWTGVTISELGGDNESLTVGSFTCPTLPPPGPPCPAAFDGRINNDPARDCAPPVAVYCTNGAAFDIYGIDGETSRGSLVLRVTQDEIDAVGVPEGANAVIAQTEGVIVSRLTTGEFQVNAWWDDGKPYTIAWESCPAEGVNHLQPQSPNE